jgi:hypothetical protein
MIEQHPGSVDTHGKIANWIAPDFFFSKTDLWDRMGFLGVFADYVLSCTKGDVLEIGVGESSIYLSHVARKYKRRIYHCDASPGKIINPLTIPGYVTVEAVDPAGQRSIKVEDSYFFMDTSDELFKMDIPPLALSFIDGDHNFEQAKKDFLNCLSLTVNDGYIILHDTSPPSEEYIHENACGDVYRLRQMIERIDYLDCLTLPVGTAIGVGLTIVRKRFKDGPHYRA